MEDIKEFKKLFKINIPVDKHFDYYIDVLQKSDYYSDLNELVSDFELYENEVLKNYETLVSYKLGYCLKTIKSYLIGTNAYNSLQNKDFGQESPRTKNILEKNEGEYLISFDFKSANYNALKSFDEDNELKGSWEELCEYLNIHPMITKSKSFRQLCFGNTNPKRLQKVQRINVSRIVENLLEYFSEEEIIFISHDEFIIKLKGDGKSSSEKALWLNNKVKYVCEKENILMPIKYNVFKEDYIKKKTAVRTFYQVKIGGLSEKHKMLFGVPGNKYFWYFKKHILNEDVEERDLLFIHDNDLAMWKI